jgi:beta-lactamase class D
MSTPILLRISADEQIEFLKKLYLEQLPGSKRSLEIVKDILTLEKTDVYKLSAKTGTGPLGEGKYRGQRVREAENGSARFIGGE